MDAMLKIEETSEENKAEATSPTIPPSPPFTPDRSDCDAGFSDEIPMPLFAPPPTLDERIEACRADHKRNSDELVSVGLTMKFTFFCVLSELSSVIKEYLECDAASKMQLHNPKFTSSPLAKSFLTNLKTPLNLRLNLVARFVSICERNPSLPALKGLVNMPVEAMARVYVGELTLKAIRNSYSHHDFQVSQDGLHMSNHLEGQLKLKAYIKHLDYPSFFNGILGAMSKVVLELRMPTKKERKEEQPGKEVSKKDVKVGKKAQPKKTQELEESV
jgi:hypothetical protein